MGAGPTFNILQAQVGAWGIESWPTVRIGGKRAFVGGSNAYRGRRGETATTEMEGNTN